MRALHTQILCHLNKKKKSLDIKSTIFFRLGEILEACNSMKGPDECQDKGLAQDVARASLGLTAITDSHQP